MMGEVATLPDDGRELTTAEIMERVLLAGDLSKLTAEERTSYYMATCRSLGLNPYTKPFEYVRLSGREVLYATKGATDQLRANKRISLEITDRSISDGLFFVSVRGTSPDGRHDEDMGAVSVKNLQGEALANAMMKATTKAKRRVTLSICGLNMPDESELEGLPVDAPAEPPRRQVAPPAARIAAPVQPNDQQPAREPIRVQFPGGGQVEHPRTKAGLKAALQTIADDPAGLVLLNLALLDNAAGLPEYADLVAELRAKAAEALTPAGDREPWPGAAAGAEEPEQDEPGATEPDLEGDRMRAHKGEVPADAEEKDVFGLPPYRGA